MLPFALQWKEILNMILEPLSPGKHDIQFKAGLTNPTTDILFYSDDIKYTIDVK
jgi:hypothetical protein